MPSKLSDLIWWPICKLLLMNCYHWKKMKLSIKNFFSKCDQIRRKPLIVIFSGKILNDRCVTRGGKGGGLPCPFSEIGKKCPKFWAKMPWLWPSMGCSFKMQFWRVSRKKRRFFLGKNSFSCCTWLFIKVPKFQENSPALKNWCLHACKKQLFLTKNYLLHIWNQSSSAHSLFFSTIIFIRFPEFFQLPLLILILFYSIPKVSFQSYS